MFLAGLFENNVSIGGAEAQRQKRHYQNDTAIHAFLSTFGACLRSRMIEDGPFCQIPGTSHVNRATAERELKPKKKQEERFWPGPSSKKGGAWHFIFRFTLPLDASCTPISSRSMVSR